MAAIAGTGNVFTSIAVFFSKMALVTFGGAYAVLAYVAQQAVSAYHWVTPGEMLDGLGMAETTPGPLIMVLQFVGFMAAFRSPGMFSPLLAGALGGLLATWVTFTPCFLWIFVGAPYIEQLRGNKALSGALSAITAAVVGVILNLAIWFAIHALFRATRHVNGFGLSFDAPVPASLNVWSLVLALGAAIAIFRFKVGMIPTLAASCAAGVVLYALGLVTTRSDFGLLNIASTRRTNMRAMTAMLFASLSLALCDRGAGRRNGLEESRSRFWPRRRRSAAPFIATDFPEPISRSPSTACSSSRALRSAAGSRSSPWATRP